jgi:hypothetical protein
MHRRLSALVGLLLVAVAAACSGSWAFSSSAPSAPGNTGPLGQTSPNPPATTPS